MNWFSALYNLATLMEKLMVDVSRLTTDVAQLHAASDKAVSMLADLAAQVAALKGQVVDPATQKALDDLAAQIEANVAALNAATAPAA